MTERREPTISVLGADKEPASTADAPRRAAPNYDARRAPSPVSGRPVVVRSKIAWFAFFLVLICIGGLGFLAVAFYESQSVVAAQAKTLQAAEARLASLENRLSLSDDESTQSMTVIQANVKENTSEIRKLWGVSYDTNRKAIDALKSTTDALSKNMKSSDAELKKSVAEIVGELAVLTELMDAQQAVIKQVDQTRNAVDLNIAALTEKMAMFQTDINKRLKSNEEAIEAIDAFRVQVNRDLLQLKGGQ